MPTTGSVEASGAERRALAAASLDWNLAQPEFMHAFPDILDIVAEERAAEAAAAQANAAAKVHAEMQAAEAEKQPLEPALEPEPGTEAGAEAEPAGNPLEILARAIAAAGEEVAVFEADAAAGRLRVGRLRGARLQASDHACPRRPGAVKRPWRFPVKIDFVWGFCMGAQGA